MHNAIQQNIQGQWPPNFKTLRSLISKPLKDYLKTHEEIYLYQKISLKITTCNKAFNNLRSLKSITFTLNKIKPKTTTNLILHDLFYVDKKVI
jgi:hypothetical protein